MLAIIPKFITGLAMYVAEPSIIAVASGVGK